MRQTKPKHEVMLIASLDTKGDLVTYLKTVLEFNGVNSVIMDVGFRGIPSIKADITREQVAAQMGKQISDLGKEKCYSIDIMSEGAKQIVEKMIKDGKINGTIGIGGAVGTILCSQAMKTMPIGFPKIIISTIPYDLRTTIGSTDIMFLYSVADVLGINPITRAVLEGAAGAILGRLNLKKPEEVSREKINVGVSALGITTSAADYVYKKLTERGFEVTVFHANGIGGSGFELAAKEGMFDGIIDLTPHEINHIIFDTPVIRKEDRLNCVTRANVPYIFVPGGLDLITQGPEDELRECYRERAYYVHSHAFTHVRVSEDEAKDIALFAANKINQCKERVGVCIPLRGFSEMNREGSKIYNKNADNIFVDILKANLDSHVIVKEVDAHINDEKFADALCSMLLAFKLKLIIK